MTNRCTNPVPPDQMAALAERFQAHQGRIAALEAGPRGPFRVENAASGGKATVRLYAPIGGWFGITPEEFAAELDALDVDEIELHVNSPGGSVYDGLAIMNTLRQHKARVVAVVDGLAASAASFIVVGGADEVVMAEHSEMMIHDAWGICVGPAADMRKMSEDLDRISDNLASIYAKKAGGATAEWREVMLEDTYYSAEQTVEVGLADRVLSDEEDDAQDDAAAAAARWEGLFTAGGSLAPAASVVANRTGRSEPVHTPSPAYLARVTTHDHEDHVHLASRVERPHTPPSASAAGSTPPVAPASGDTTQEGAAVFTDEQLNSLRQSLGVAADADEQTILDALHEVLEEQAADEPAAEATPTAPEGMVLIETDQLATLQQDAAAGREARNQQLREEREDLVNSAVRDGRVSPARRDHWLARLEADEGEAEVLAALPKIIPLDEIGYDAPSPLEQETDAQNTTYSRLWGGQTEKEA